jgi:hypothetical protein
MGTGASRKIGLDRNHLKAHAPFHCPCPIVTVITAAPAEVLSGQYHPAILINLSSASTPVERASHTERMFYCPIVAKREAIIARQAKERQATSTGGKDPQHFGGTAQK